MKKTLSTLLVISLIFFLSGCFTSKDDINKAKENIWIIETTEKEENLWEETNSNINNDDTSIEKKDNIEKIIVEKEEEIKEKKDEFREIEIIYWLDKLLEFNSFDWENIFDWEVEIKWKTLWEVEKIIVTFDNDSSDFPLDKYTLKQFKSWDKDFLYRAFSRYETLDYWKNTYLFEAYYWDKISKSEVIINVIKKEEKSVKDKVSESYKDFDLNDLPVSADFWTPVDLWNWKISYSDLSWLEIKNEVNSDLTCETITSTLADKINTWFFWNTCIPIEDEEWISFFVIKLDWDNYIYEKHYYLSYQWIYWIQELETWVWVDKTNIWEKNSELKLVNEDFSILKITDDLFKQILK